MGLQALHYGGQLQVSEKHFSPFYKKYLLYFPIDGKET